MTDSDLSFTPPEAPVSRRGPGAVLMLVVLVVLCLTAGFSGSLFTAPALEPWYADLSKPIFNPPNWVFAPVWTVLFILMGVAAWLVWRAPVEWTLKRGPLFSFVVHLAINVGWSAAFFGGQSPLLGLLVIAVLLVWIVWLGVRFARIVPLAGMLFVPYVLWVGYASLVNASIWWLNR